MFPLQELKNKSLDGRPHGIHLVGENEWGLSAAFLIVPQHQGPFVPPLHSGPHCCFRCAKDSTLTCCVGFEVAADRPRNKSTAAQSDAVNGEEDIEEG